MWLILMNTFYCFDTYRKIPFFALESLHRLTQRKAQIFKRGLYKYYKNHEEQRIKGSLSPDFSCLVK
jgi:hypothetical protein